MISSSKNTICFVNTHKSWGGGEEWHLAAATYFYKQRGFEVSLLANPKGELYSKARNNGLSVRPISLSNWSVVNPLKWISVYRLIKDINPKLVILNLPSDIKLVGLISKWLQTPQIIYRRGSAKAIRRSILNRFLFQKVLTGVIVNSLATKNTLLEKNPDLIEENKIILSYNGVLTSQVNSITNKKRENNQGPIIIGTAGRLSPEKNQIALIRVAKILKSKGVDFRILIAGKGPLSTMLENEIQKNNLKNSVKLVGFEENIFDFMGKLDIYVHTAKYEGFGFVFIEAMTSSIPVIVFDIPTAHEIVDDGKSGFIVPMNNYELLAERIEFLKNNPENLIQMGDEGNRIVKEKFIFEQKMDDLIDQLSLRNNN